MSNKNQPARLEPADGIFDLSIIILKIRNYIQGF